jgi:hypothetical protein
MQDVRYVVTSNSDRFLVSNLAEKRQRITNETVRPKKVSRKEGLIGNPYDFVKLGK